MENVRDYVTVITNIRNKAGERQNPPKRDQPHDDASLATSLLPARKRRQPSAPRDRVGKPSSPERSDLSAWA